MTPEERISELEGAVIRLGNILELRLGAFANNAMDPRVISEGEHFHHSAKSVEVRRRA
jgi:hypothetical protein